MNTLLDEIARAIEAGIYGPALLATLMLPDACGAIEFPDIQNPGRNSKRYIAWYDGFVEPIVDDDFRFDGAAAWKVRNGMIHETGLRFTEYGFDRIIFSIPDDNSPSFGAIVTRDVGPMAESALTLGLDQFFQRVRAGVNSWLGQIGSDQEKLDRLGRLIQYRPNGLLPFVWGVPLIV